MTLSLSYVACGNVHEEIKTLSVYNCIFCNEFLNGKAKMLECLHVICYECIEKKIDNSGLKCKCLTVTDVTNGFIVDYPIKSSSISKSEKCELCDSETNKYCIYCKDYFYKSCSKVHLNNSRGCTQSPDLVMSYPKTNQLVLCTSCSKKNAEVYCTQCSMMICCLCHLCLHHNHSFKILDELYDEIKASLSEELYKLKKNDEYFKNVLDRISKVTQKLKTKRKSVLDEIDTVAQKLHDEVNKRSLELKELAEHSFKDSIVKINKNREILQNTQEKFKYDMKLVKTVMEHNKIDEFIQLSKTVLKKLKLSKMISTSEVSVLEDDLKFNNDESIDNSISTNKNVGNISVKADSLPEMFEDNIETPNNNSDHFMNLQSTNLNDNHNFKEEILAGSVNSYTESGSSYDDQLFADCSCCKQLDNVNKLIHCNFCGRYFHHECHIPTVLNNSNTHNLSRIKWKCTLCRDLTKYAKVLNQKNMNGIIPVGKTELIIMERILMEIYCQSDDSEHFRTFPNEKDYLACYQKASSRLSLNDVKKTLESNESYTSLIQFLLDIKKVYSNGLSYYPPCDPYYKSAANLQLFLQRLINTWIPKLSDINRLC